MVALLELMGSEGPHSAQLRSMDQGWPMSDQAVLPIMRGSPIQIMRGSPIQEMNLIVGKPSVADLADRHFGFRRVKTYLKPARGSA